MFFTDDMDMRWTIVRWMGLSSVLLMKTNFAQFLVAALNEGFCQHDSQDEFVSPPGSSMMRTHWQPAPCPITPIWTVCRPGYSITSGSDPKNYSTASRGGTSLLTQS